jgi:hypothetical protein
VYRNIDELVAEMEGVYSAPFATFVAAAKRAKFDVDLKGGSTHFVPTVSAWDGSWVGARAGAGLEHPNSAVMLNLCTPQAALGQATGRAHHLEEQPS